jgi:hypothetical protein
VSETFLEPNPLNNPPINSALYFCFNRGTLVEVRFHGHDSWYPAKIVLNHLDGTCAVQYDDGEIETHVDPSMIRKRLLVGKEAGGATKRQRGAKPKKSTMNPSRDLYTVSPYFSSLTPQFTSSSNPDPTVIMWEFTEFFIYIWLLSAFFSMLGPMLA